MNAVVQFAAFEQAGFRMLEWVVSRRGSCRSIAQPADAMAYQGGSCLTRIATEDIFIAIGIVKLITPAPVMA